MFEEVPACVEWRITPEEGAEIDPVTGELKIDLDTPAGTVFTVETSVENGRHIVTDTVTVYTPEANPMVGFWTESGQYICGSAFEVEVVPGEVIGEMQFTADGDFSVTCGP